MKKKEYINLDELVPIDDLDDEELELHRLLTTGKTKSIDSEELRGYYTKVFKESNSRSKAVNIRLKEQDYIGLKAKAMELGMPYQSLLNSIVHQFLTGKLKSIK